MDILNFISWIKSGNYRATLPTDTPSLLAVGAKDPSRDDGYLTLAVNAAPLQSLYNTANVTQITSITTAVTVNSHNGIITTVPVSIAAGGTALGFIVNNSNVTTSSRILLSCEFPAVGTGIPNAFVINISNGSFTIRIANGGSFVLNQAVKVHFMIIN
jgi:hypothetical protein